MSARRFVDTNILVYAHDRGAGTKHKQAKELVRSLWQDRAGILSTQVIQEFYVNVIRKAQRPISRAEAQRLVEDYLCWEIIVNDGSSILEALDIERSYTLSFWDALIIQAAHAAGTEVLYSEDFNHGQVYGAVKVVNPFFEEKGH